MTKCPCKGCDDRTVTCHSVCRRYQGWKDEHAAEIRHNYEQNRVCLSDHSIRQHWRNLKAGRRKLGRRDG